jgi:hypothetical protein
MVSHQLTGWMHHNQLLECSIDFDEAAEAYHLRRGKLTHDETNGRILPNVNFAWIRKRRLQAGDYSTRSIGTTRNISSVVVSPIATRINAERLKSIIPF